MRALPHAAVPDPSDKASAAITSLLEFMRPPEAKVLAQQPEAASEAMEVSLDEASSDRVTGWGGGGLKTVSAQAACPPHRAVWGAYILLGVSAPFLLIGIIGLPIGVGHESPPYWDYFTFYDNGCVIDAVDHTYELVTEQRSCGRDCSYEVRRRYDDYLYYFDETYVAHYFVAQDVFSMRR